MTHNRAVEGPVAVDTGVFAAELLTWGISRDKLRTLLEGRPFIVSFVTVAEVRFGGQLAGWGAPRLQRLEERLARARIVWPGPELLAVHVDL